MFIVYFGANSMLGNIVMVTVYK